MTCQTAIKLALCMASECNHTHLIQLPSTTQNEVSAWYPAVLALDWYYRAWIRLKSIIATVTIRITKIHVQMRHWYLKYQPIPLSWPSIRCTTHGPSFTRVRYIKGVHSTLPEVSLIKNLVNSSSWPNLLQFQGAMTRLFLPYLL